jgi:FGGY-family pentulose kinase
MARSESCFIGIDVGTGSARAGVFDLTGHMLGSGSTPIQIWKPQPDFVQQSSDDIWRACCHATRVAVRQAGVKPELVAGLGFDAACSLVVLGANGQPVSVSPKGEPEQNVIVWMDHRAIEQADRINAGTYEPLRYVGGTISPEMETPKVLWIKENLSETWREAAHFFDLPDFLTFKATNDFGRSLCSLVCKWTYLSHQVKRDALQGWSDDYWSSIGLGDVVKEGYRRVGTCVRALGQPVGQGLSTKAASELGLRPGTPVSTSIIDAHAGALSVLGMDLGEDVSPGTLETRLVMVAGTSSGHLAVSNEPKYIPGCWGPYYSALVPDFWLTEAGQSAVGALLDHIIYTHAAYRLAQQAADADGLSIFDFLNRRLDQMSNARRLRFPAQLTANLHVYPDFHGNRSPHANPSLRGMICGLRLSADIDDLAVLYLATIQSIAYQVRHIIEEMNAQGYRIQTLIACGGGLKNDVFLREHADITGCNLVMPREPEAMLLGSALLGAVAAGAYPSIISAMRAMAAPGRQISPAKRVVQLYHDDKYRVYHRMYLDQLAYRELMPDGQTSASRLTNDEIKRVLSAH